MKSKSGSYSKLSARMIEILKRGFVLSDPVSACSQRLSVFSIRENSKPKI